MYTLTLETHSAQCTVEPLDVVELFIPLSSYVLFCSQLHTYYTKLLLFLESVITHFYTNELSTLILLYL